MVEVTDANDDPSPEQALVPVEKELPAPEKKVRRSPYTYLEENQDLQAAIRIALPPRYHFEIEKTIWKIQKSKAAHAGLQFPDGLLQWATQIAEILKRFAPEDGRQLTVTIMGDINYGACCIDDIGGAAVGVDFLVHYGHSCLVPVDQTVVKTMYVFVRIDVDMYHLIETIKLNFPEPEETSFSLMGTAQFNAAIAGATEALKKEGYDVVAPRATPLSQGEGLGCTAPTLTNDICINICDGRFHIEALMMQNKDVTFYRYDPYTQVFTTESFDHEQLEKIRTQEILKARDAKVVGLILGTLGRQGSVGVLEGVRSLFEEHNVETFTILLSEITKEKLDLFPTVDAWVQIACPRLSLDWGHFFTKPLLSSYEAYTIFDKDMDIVGPMDYYANRAGPWGNYGVSSHGGSVKEKFWHLGQKAKRIIAYEN